MLTTRTCLAVAALATPLLIGCASPVPLDAAKGRTFPQLEIVVACGECAVSDDWKEKLEQSYADFIAKAGATIDRGSAAVLTIKDFFYRSTLLLVATGPVGNLVSLGFPDKIAGELAYKNQSQPIEVIVRQPFPILRQQRLTNATSEEIVKKLLEK